jgi:hypothetical protein
LFSLGSSRIYPYSIQGPSNGKGRRNKKEKKKERKVCPSQPKCLNTKSQTNITKIQVGSKVTLTEIW